MNADEGGAGRAPPSRPRRARWLRDPIDVQDPDFWGPLHHLAEWAAAQRGARSLGDILRLRDDLGAIPPDIEEAWARVAAAPVAEPPPEQGTGAVSLRMIVEALAGLDARARRIFRARTLGMEDDTPEPQGADTRRRRKGIPARAPTLEALGQRYGVTRERIRQIQQKTARRLRGTLMANRESGWLMADLRTALGVAFPLERFRDHPFLGGLLGAEEEVWRTALWLAGYAAPEEGWIAQEGVAPEALRERVRQAAWDGGGLGHREAVAMLAAAGMLPAAAEALLEPPPQGLKRFGDEFLPWKPSLTDKAEALLRWLHRPATDAELFGLIDEERNPRGFRNRLTDDARFARTKDGAAFVLREWGLEERITLSDAIAAWIEDAGGEGSLAALVPEVAAQGAWAESSVRIYAYAPRFVVKGGRVRLRREGEPFELPAGDPAGNAQIERLGRDRLRYRVEVIHDTLRGSGRPAPGAFAVALGVLPDQERTYVSPSGAAVRVTWSSRAPQPSLGSVKALAEEVGAELGDILTLDFDTARGTVTASRLRASGGGGTPA